MRDQLVRLLDVAYSSIVTKDLFPRVPYVLVVGVWEKEPALVTRYRNADNLAAALAHHSRFPDHQKMATALSERVSYMSWSGLRGILTSALTAAGVTEKGFLADVIQYIDHRIQALRPKLGVRKQVELPGFLEPRDDEAKEE